MLKFAFATLLLLTILFGYFLFQSRNDVGDTNVTEEESTPEQVKKLSKSMAKIYLKLQEDPETANLRPTDYIKMLNHNCVEFENICLTLTTRILKSDEFDSTTMNYIQEQLKTKSKEVIREFLEGLLTNLIIKENILKRAVVYNTLTDLTEGSDSRLGQIINEEMNAIDLVKNPSPKDEKAILVYHRAFLKYYPNEKEVALEKTNKLVNKIPNVLIQDRVRENYYTFYANLPNTVGEQYSPDTVSDALESENRNIDSDNGDEYISVDVSKITDEDE